MEVDSLAGQTLSEEGESLVTLVYPTCAQRSGFLKALCQDISANCCYF